MNPKVDLDSPVQNSVERLLSEQCSKHRLVDDEHRG